MSPPTLLISLTVQMMDHDFNRAYIGSRSDIVEHIKDDVTHVLDVGCSVGALGQEIKDATGAHVVGIELSKDMAELASQRLDKVYVGDAEKLLVSSDFDHIQFDTIIFADVLEHLIDPWGALASCKRLLTPRGSIVASVPNIRHISTLYNLVIKGYWPYRDRGIHDRTHLRFFTKKNLFELFGGSGYRITGMSQNYRLIESPNRLNRFAKYVSFPGIREFLVFQYIVTAHVQLSRTS